MKSNQLTYHVYSSLVSDIFTLSVNLPKNYEVNSKKKFPVVYLLDANLYFDVISAALQKYSDVGLAPEVILVGIGYKDFAAMDSLRTRDYTYPVGLREYEMSVSGGGNNFLNSIRNELIPFIERKYKTDSSKRVLMGHSLGGYFASYAFMKGLADKQHTFLGYIAASPSLHYNHYWIIDEMKAAVVHPKNNSTARFFIGFGGIEDNESVKDTSMRKLPQLLDNLTETFSAQKGIRLKTEIYSNLDHMDTPFPTFMKGLKWIFGE